MARSRRVPITKSNNPQIERQARRISRQQKQLDREMLVDMGQNVGLTGAKSRAIRKSDIKVLKPLTDTQADFFEAYEDGVEAFVLYGSAGTGKTTIAIGSALLEVFSEDSTYEKIIIIRSSAQSRNQGHLPGDIDLKMEAFESPYHSICEFLTNRKEAYEKLKESGKIEFMSSSFLRGVTFDNSIVIVDEAQNFTWQELSTTITRVGKDTKIIFCCDYAQNDLVQNKNDVSGLREFIDVTKKMEEFVHIRFTSSDIVRSGLVKSFIIQCEHLGL